jgi:parallel beta-helix repeat protein
LGIYLQESSSFNNISNNFLKGNDFGISIENSEYNIIYHNDFIENNLGGTSQSRDEGSNNSWYNVSISEGNYWSDWNGIGSYVIDSVTFGDVVDLYPLAESDGDGMPNDWEEEVGTDPYVFDSHLDPDNDGLDNLSEYLNSTHPFLNDSDSDGLSDGDEVLVYLTSPIMTDSDSDGLDDFEEIFTYFTNATNEDTDGDGMTDGWEAYYSLDPLIDDSALDSDYDGLTNIYEFIYGTDPSDEDTDGDTLLDYDEIFVYYTNALNPDTDGDMLTDGEEVNIYGTSPLDEDSDSDGLLDGEEVNLYLTDPLNEDSDGDGYPDGEEVDNGYDPLDPKSNYSRYRTSQILMYVLYSVLSVFALAILFFGQKYLRRHLLTKSIKQQGFQSLEEMQTAQNRGFRTKSEFDEANSSGFVNFDEYNLAKALDLLNKSGLISTASADVEQVALQIQSSEKRLKNLQEFINLEYDIGHLAEYETTIHEIESTLKKAITGIESYNKIEDKQTQELVYSILLLGNRILTARIPQLQADLNVRKDYLKNFVSVVDLTKKFHPQVPVSLERIVSLANLSQEVVIAYLKDITINMPQIGNYLELEQVFIRQYSDNQDLKTFYNQAREKYKEKIIGSEVQPACVYCKSEFDEIDRTEKTICQNCGKEAPTCPICKQSMFHGEDLVIEKNCGNIFHKNHIVMWIRSEELCPVCKKRINENSLEPYEQESKL